jgi:hypothetical protein
MGISESSFDYPPTKERRCAFQCASKILQRGNIFMPAAEIKAAWEALKARTPPEQLAAAYRAMNIRGDG